MREYEEIDPIILGTDQEDEITIGEVANKIIKATGYTGQVWFPTKDLVSERISSLVTLDAF